MFIKLFFFFRTLFYSTATFILLIFVSLFLKLGKFALPAALIISIIILAILIKNAKKVMKDFKKKAPKKLEIKDIVSFLVTFSITTIGILFLQHFDYMRCIATGYCWR